MIPFKAELKVLSMRRSGMHAIINWLGYSLRHAFFVNDVCGPSPLDECHYAEPGMCKDDIADGSVYGFVLYSQKTKTKIAGTPVDFMKNNTPASCLIYNYEDKKYESVNQIRELVPSNNKLKIIILRDPYTLAASRLKKKTQLGSIAGDFMFGELHETWVSHTNAFFNPDVIGIYFNDWFSSLQYRESILKLIQSRINIKIDFSDHGINEVPDYAFGSSFDHLDFNSKAQSMDVLNRCKTINVSLPEFVEKTWTTFERKYSAYNSNNTLASA